jgi:hypothetical protein
MLGAMEGHDTAQLGAVVAISQGLALDESQPRGAAGSATPPAPSMLSEEAFSRKLSEALYRASAFETARSPRPIKHSEFTVTLPASRPAPAAAAAVAVAAVALSAFEADAEQGDVLHAGAIHKRGRIVTGWRRRHAVLHRGGELHSIASHSIAQLSIAQHSTA